ncbi:tryptophan synthase subunit alpha [Pelobacter propionicus]|uniref:Tryptophan synthase alpha chain n=1 Tax=Pelobacter propionicus (strain DSM 2379 / NBRC 103807 / OttBd1) TaxID=338966 RepID=TRPA_PELPD|nr:tryptophan synthase subunit alpha [Pelobacter propionicus]A1AN65.1 RecName: Full=Tryptophan synthase alpha chain [Pelobacter propionicus DSM 2379]ABK98785.1 tryptophan synthase, alpha chain [Pelobacter propionicus DSM 2379]
MNRLTHCFNELKQRNTKALVTFITAGDPDLATTQAMIPLLQQAGADIIELGMPFSDPMADGPTIQLSSERALAASTTLERILAMVRAVRRSCQVPIVLMGYLNPIHAYGYERFANDAAEAGVDGVLVVDMPPEEAESFLNHANARDLQVAFLLTPTSTDSRIATVGRLGRGFVYYVTVTGVTGARQQVSTTLGGELAKVRAKISVPIVAGFGISTPQQAADVAAMADGVVVGSALVKLFQLHSGEELRQEVTRFVASLRQAIPGGAA